MGNKAFWIVGMLVFSAVGQGVVLLHDFLTAKRTYDFEAVECIPSCEEVLLRQSWDGWEVKTVVPRGEKWVVLLQRERNK